MAKIERKEEIVLKGYKLELTEEEFNTLFVSFGMTNFTDRDRKANEMGLKCLEMMKGFDFYEKLKESR